MRGVSWQICVASLQESLTWVYSRFHWWCSNAWEDGGITSAKCATNLCDMFFTKYSNSATKVFFWEQHYSQVVFQYAKTSVNTAGHSFETCFCLSKKTKQYIWWTYEIQWCFYTIRTCYIAISFRINLDQSKTETKRRKNQRFGN
jgi:hypothetical protein